MYFVIFHELSHISLFRTVVKRRVSFPESSANFMFYIVQNISICLAWILQPLQFSLLPMYDQVTLSTLCFSSWFTQI